MPNTDTAAAPANPEWLIHSYTRAEALADHVLVDVTPTAREADLKIPTAVTAAVFNKCIEWTDDDARRSRTCQDQPGRLWDVLHLATVKARALVQAGKRRNQLLYQLHVVPPPRPQHLRLRTLKLVIHPGDDAEPVATIMLPYED